MTSQVMKYWNSNKKLFSIKILIFVQSYIIYLIIDDHIFYSLSTTHILGILFSEIHLIYLWTEYNITYKNDKDKKFYWYRASIIDTSNRIYIYSSIIVSYQFLFCLFINTIVVVARIKYTSISLNLRQRIKSYLNT